MRKATMLGIACSIISLAACVVEEPVEQDGDEMGETAGDEHDGGDPDDGEPAPDLGDGGDEPEGEEAGEGEGEGGDMGDDEGGELCELPPIEGEYGATVEQIELVNVGTMPIFIVPDPCEKSLYTHTQVEGIEVVDETLTSCEAILAGGCGSCDNGEYLVEPVRIDPGARFLWSFDGHVYESAPLAESCQPCDDADSCHVGWQVDVGSRVRLGLRTATGCSAEGPTACICTEGTGACQLPEIRQFAAANFYDFTDVTFELDLLGNSTTVELSH